MNRKDKAITPNYYDNEFKKLIKHKFTEDQQITISEFNAFKYLYRWKEKNGVQDLKKAVWYIKDIVKKLESQEKAEKEQESALNKQLFKKYINCIYKPEELSLDNIKVDTNK